MTIHILAVSIVSFAGGIVLCLYIGKRDRLNLFVLVMMLLGMVFGIAGAIVRVEMEKTKARIEELKKLEAATGK